MAGSWEFDQGFVPERNIAVFLEPILFDGKSVEFEDRGGEVTGWVGVIDGLDVEEDVIDAVIEGAEDRTIWEEAGSGTTGYRAVAGIIVDDEVADIATDEAEGFGVMGGHIL